MKGIAVKTSMDPSQTVQYTALISGITKQVDNELLDCFNFLSRLAL